MFLPAYSQLNKINQSINPCNLKGGRYTSSGLRLYYSNDSFLYLIESPLQRIFLKLALSFLESDRKFQNHFRPYDTKGDFFFFFFLESDRIFFPKKASKTKTSN